MARDKKVKNKEDMSYYNILLQQLTKQWNNKTNNCSTKLPNFHQVLNVVH